MAPSLQPLLGLALDMTCPCAGTGLTPKTGCRRLRKHPNLERHPSRAAAYSSFLCIPAPAVKASREGGMQGVLALPSIPSPWEERYPGCSKLGSDGTQRLIRTNGPRKAGSALQRRTHSSNNLNSSASPSKKSLRREERPYS